MLIIVGARLALARGNCAANKPFLKLIKLYIDIEFHSRFLYNILGEYYEKT